eukprot:1736-Prymnesium_polylepis.3
MGGAGWRRWLVLVLVHVIVPLEARKHRYGHGSPADSRARSKRKAFRKKQVISPLERGRAIHLILTAVAPPPSSFTPRSGLFTPSPMYEC